MLMVMCQPPLRNVGSPLGRMSSVFVILWSRLTQRPKEWWQQRGGSGERAQMGHTHKMRGLDCGEHWPHWAIRDAVALACCKWPVWRYFCQDKIKVIKYSYLHATHKRNATNRRDVHRMHGSRLKCFVISARTWLNVWGKGGGYSGQLRSMGFIWAGWGHAQTSLHHIWSSRSSSSSSNIRPSRLLQHITSCAADVPPQPPSFPPSTFCATPLVSCLPAAASIAQLLIFNYKCKVQQQQQQQQQCMLHLPAHAN